MVAAIIFSEVGPHSNLGYFQLISVFPAPITLNKNVIFCRSSILLFSPSSWPALSNSVFNCILLSQHWKFRLVIFMVLLSDLRGFGPCVTLLIPFQLLGNRIKASCLYPLWQKCHYITENKDILWISSATC